MKKNSGLLIAVFFSIAMGYLESVVVTYLRTILTRRPDWLMIEISREAATLVMLVSFAFVSGKNAVQRTGFFLLSFGIWDIVYYLGLKIWLRWPSSLLTMDTLFYIPCKWASPVYIPVLFSLLMIILGILLILEQGLDLIRPGARWAMYGWISGGLAGAAMALGHHLPVAISVMGLSCCCGLIAAGMGLGSAIATRWSRIVPVIVLSATIGALSGLLGHLARSMFYLSAASWVWPVGVAMFLNLLVTIVIMRRKQG
ncbi:MAG: hypothetical protein KKG09_02325 [Verrucomicrobia bacterium]|nr:hypothetical protein [Verrucomicrobiota bacterium]MCG2679046.1 hypothetical protein [Kiritimatiellia bacterium]MBU4247572.1 hypothetical protein [Verrucomicrobiota bacterium]MBU4291186.1 hypothetical protein [Verrucomicrobiota bacterium]MBU4428471.1 hypothetical protein [Verrucomicrobiota bacterium]